MTSMKQNNYVWKIKVSEVISFSLKLQNDHIWYYFIIHALTLYIATCYIVYLVINQTQLMHFLFLGICIMDLQAIFGEIGINDGHLLPINTNVFMLFVRLSKWVDPVNKFILWINCLKLVLGLSISICIIVMIKFNNTIQFICRSIISNQMLWFAQKVNEIKIENNPIFWQSISLYNQKMNSPVIPSDICQN